jgi:DNA-binding Lrp family transcriptional regulator
MNNRGILADNINPELLRLLQKNPRASVSELARRIKMSNPAVKERILRLEESGILAGYRLELNPKTWVMKSWHSSGYGRCPVISPRWQTWRAQPRR